MIKLLCRNRCCVDCEFKCTAIGRPRTIDDGRREKSLFRRLRTCNAIRFRNVILYFTLNLFQITQISMFIVEFVNKFHYFWLYIYKIIYHRVIAPLPIENPTLYVRWSLVFLATQVYWFFLPYSIRRQQKISLRVFSVWHGIVMYWRLCQSASVVDLRRVLHPLHFPSRTLRESHQDEYVQ